MSRLTNVLTWVERLRRLCPIEALSLELVRFDTHLLEHAGITGFEYQQGELAGYGVREFLTVEMGPDLRLLRGHWPPLEVEHLPPRSRGGSDRVSNLTPACASCNQQRGAQTAAEFGFPHLQARAKQPLKDAAAVNATRWALYERLKASGLPVEGGTGVSTRWNRTKRGLPKTYWTDAACVGASTPEPVRHRTRQKRFYGFQTGDMVRAVIPGGKYAGVQVGRVTVRARPSFRVQSMDVHPKYLKKVWCQDGYAYDQATAALPPRA